MKPAWLHHWEWEILFEPRDIWIGCYWKRYNCAIELYFILIPMIPLRIYVQWHWRNRPQKGWPNDSAIIPKTK